MSAEGLATVKSLVAAPTSSSVLDSVRNNQIIFAGRTTIAILVMIIIVFGIGGNCLSIRVLREKNLSKSSTSLYLTALAVVDIVVLLVGPTLASVESLVTFPTHPRSYHWLACKLHIFLNYSVTQISAWILVSVTIDRMIYVVFPFRAQKYCTKKRTAYVIASIFASICTLNFSKFFTFFVQEINASGNGSSNFSGPVQYACTSENEYEILYINIDVCITVVIPFIVMLVANLFIIRKLRVVKQRREQALHKSSRKEHKSSLTSMLLTTSIFYLCSSLPYVIYMNINKLIGTTIGKDDPTIIGIGYIIYSFLRLLFNLNYALHFFLYCLSGPAFKREAFRILRSIVKKDKEPNAPQKTLATTMKDSLAPEKEANEVESLSEKEAEENELVVLDNGQV